MSNEEDVEVTEVEAEDVVGEAPRKTMIVQQPFVVLNLTAEGYRLVASALGLYANLIQNGSVELTDLGDDYDFEGAVELLTAIGGFGDALLGIDGDGEDDDGEDDDGDEEDLDLDEDDGDEDEDSDADEE